MGITTVFSPFFSPIPLSLYEKVSIHFYLDAGDDDDDDDDAAACILTSSSSSPAPPPPRAAHSADVKKIKVVT